MEIIHTVQEKEVFVPVPGFEGRFKISNLGRVISTNGKYSGEKEISGSTDSAGYRVIVLNGNGKRVYQRLHALLAESFIPKPRLDDLVVNHKDGDKSNNRLDNLEWITRGDNTRHAVETGLMDHKGEKHPLSKLTDEQVLEIRKLYHKHSQQEIADMFGLSPRHVWDIAKGVCWPHLPLCDYSGRTLESKERVNRRAFTPEQEQEIKELLTGGMGAYRIHKATGLRLSAVESVVRRIRKAANK